MQISHALSFGQTRARPGPRERHPRDRCFARFTTGSVDRLNRCDVRLMTAWESHPGGDRGSYQGIASAIPSKHQQAVGFRRCPFYRLPLRLPPHLSLFVAQRASAVMIQPSVFLKDPHKRLDRHGCVEAFSPGWKRHMPGVLGSGTETQPGHSEG